MKTPSRVISLVFFVISNNIRPYKVILLVHPYLGTVVGGKRGVENGPAGGDSDISRRGGEALFAQGGKGTVKFQKEP